MGMRDLSAGLIGLRDIELLYREFFKDQSGLGIFQEQISNGENLWDRNNWNGHLTASAIVLNDGFNQCLVMHHRKLGIELVPGGHCDPFEHPAESAKRELAEETGLQDALIHHWHSVRKCPIDIDTHPIPSNLIKQEPPHFHHDFRYIFVVGPDCELTLNQSEGSWLGWKEVSVLDELYPRVYERIRRYL